MDKGYIYYLGAVLNVILVIASIVLAMKYNFPYLLLTIIAWCAIGTVFKLFVG